MKDGQIPGSIGTSAAIYFKNHLKILGTFPGSSRTVATFVNSLGEAVGYSYKIPARRVQALLFANDRVQDLDPASPDGTLDEALIIGDRDEIYGISGFIGDNGPNSLVEFAPKVGVEPVMIGTTAAKGQVFNINSAGRFSATAESDLEPFHDSVAAAGYGVKITPIIPNILSTVATWINDNGDEVGFADLTNNPNGGAGPWTAYVHTKAGTQYLPSLPKSTDMEPTGINNHGAIVGNSDPGTVSGLRHPFFLYTNGTMYNLIADIRPAGLGLYGALPGLSDDGAFVASGKSGYYVVEPTSK